ncbi:hypothetical protein [Actinokineospora xionganensis]|uniref:Uncharacterized protein n=1 Tax=Actinokineospora xionganensis TaxID=2684470 RepID=A0ABR7LD96_9PSEU|nr:hypothetical protein [Actinokineospora xionganensis]MBC6450364.1 hypothetical protein [Actinokineospora xionganensis]
MGTRSGFGGEQVRQALRRVAQRAGDHGDIRVAQGEPRRRARVAEHRVGPAVAASRSQVIASIAGEADSRTPDSVSMSKRATITPGH